MKKTIIFHFILNIGISLIVSSCNSEKAQNLSKSNSNGKSTTVEINKNNGLDENENLHIDTLTFINYNDDSDYYFIIAQKGNENEFFINDDEDRSLNRGDLIEVQWKMETFYEAGDGDAEYQAKSLVKLKKLKDGNMSNFKKSYKKDITFMSFSVDNFSDEYVQKMYDLVVYYISNTSDELILQSIKGGDQISFSIEEVEIEGKPQKVVRINRQFEHKLFTLQSLYTDYENQNTLYEYDLANDEWVEFK